MPAEATWPRHPCVVWLVSPKRVGVLLEGNLSLQGEELRMIPRWCAMDLGRLIVNLWRAARSEQYKYRSEPMYHSLEISLTIISTLRSDLALDHRFPPFSLVSCQSTPLTTLPSPLGQSPSHVLSLTVRQTTLGQSSLHDRPLTLRRITLGQPAFARSARDLPVHLPKVPLHSELHSFTLSIPS